MNVVMTGAGRFVEVQGTAEGAAFSRDELDALLGLAAARHPRADRARRSAAGLAWRREAGARVGQSRQAAGDRRDARAARDRSGRASRARHRRGRGAARHLSRERARQGAPCEPRRAACRRSPTIPGLCVDALGGEPGVHSAYYAGREGDREQRDARNNAKLLRELRNERRRAYYVLRDGAGPSGRTIRSRSSPKASGTARSRARRAARTASATTRCFFCQRLGKTAAELDPDDKEPHQPPRASPCKRLLELAAMNPVIALSVPARSRLAALPPLALYVHIPWCVRKCPYCDFNSHERSGRAAREGVRRRSCLPIWRAHAALGLGAAADQRVHRRRHAEPVLAASRSTRCSPACARACRSSRTPRSRWRRIPARSRRRASAASATAGVNRISHRRAELRRRDARRARPHPFGATRRGARSSRARELRQRQHRPHVRPAGPERRRWRAPTSPRRRAAACRTFRPTSSPSSRTPSSGASRRTLPGARRRAPTCSSRWRRRSATRASSTTRPLPSRSPGRRCRHNLNYWEFGDYLGIGAGAHGKVSFPDRVTRHERVKQPADYLTAD